MLFRSVEPFRVLDKAPELLNPHPSEQHPIVEQAVSRVELFSHLLVLVRVEDLGSLFYDVSNTLHLTLIYHYL